jgi:long-chain acyl-CoA synthetase
LYVTLGEGGLETSLVQTHAKTIFVDGDLLTKLIKPLAKATDVKFIVYNNTHETNQSDIEALKKAHSEVIILSFDKLRNLGDSNPTKPVPPEPEEICCIMYTSGSIGVPKGVPLTHKNIVAAGKPPFSSLTIPLSLFERSKLTTSKLQA